MRDEISLTVLAAEGITRCCIVCEKAVPSASSGTAPKSTALPRTPAGVQRSVEQRCHHTIIAARQ